MKIPKSFSCGGSTINVEIVKKLAGRHGEWVSGKNLIRIAEASEEVMVETFFHELVHAIRDRYGHTLPEENDEENTTEGIAQGFVQFLRTSE